MGVGAGVLALGISALPAPSTVAAAPAPALAGAVPGDDWLVETPEAHGMDPSMLEQSLDYAFADGRNAQGVVVVHDGVIVAERYAPGADANSWAASWSMAKSFTSALIGIAIEEGAIPSVDVPMTAYYPQWAGTPLEAITLRQVLHMETGRDWDENYDPTSLESSEIINMVALQPDQLAFAVDRPLAHAPGTVFNYSSGDTMLLSGVLEQATGMRVEDYARAKLIGPLGIDQFDWWRDVAGHTLTYCCIDTTTRDFARFGLLFERGGDWGGTQVVPSSWVDASVTDTAASYGGYGYQWWLSPTGSGSIPPYFAAAGHDGQEIFVIPSLDLVVVHNSFYGKSPCPAVADPNLLYHYPPQGLVPGWGTVGPDSWSDEAFLGPIVASLTGGQPALPADHDASPVPARAEAVWPGVDPADVAAPAACPTAAPVTTTPSTASTAAPAAAVTPAFTG